MGAPGTTPGEWLMISNTVYGLNDKGVNRFSAQVQCGFTDQHHRTPDAELRANAHQMRASGALYDALEEVTAAMRKYEMDVDADAPAVHLEMMRKAYAALAQARGESS